MKSTVQKFIYAFLLASYIFNTSCFANKDETLTKKKTRLSSFKKGKNSKKKLPLALLLIPIPIVYILFKNKNGSSNSVENQTSQENISNDISNNSVKNQTSQENISNDISNNSVKNQTLQKNISNDISNNSVKNQTSQENISNDISNNSVKNQTSQENISNDISNNSVKNQTSQENISNDISNNSGGSQIPSINYDDEHVKEAKSWIERGIDINDEFSRHVGENNKEAVKYLIEQGANVEPASDMGVSPLHVACVNKCKDVVKILLENGANVMTKSSGFTPLSWLLRDLENPKPEDVEIVKLLVNNDKIKIDDEIFFDKAALEIACRKGLKDIVKIILEKGANPNLSEDNAPLFYVLTRSSYLEIVPNLKEIIELLLNKDKTNIDHQDEYGNTALYFACKNATLKNLEVWKDLVKIFLDNGANPNLPDNNTPLSCLFSRTSYDKVISNVKEIIKLLLNKDNTDISYNYYNNNTALHIACERGWKDIVEILLKKGADPNFANEYSETPLNIARDKYDKSSGNDDEKENFRQIIELLTTQK